VADRSLAIQAWRAASALTAPTTAERTPSANDDLALAALGLASY
jgi:hypothetical protein